MKNVYHIAGIEKRNKDNETQLLISGWYEYLEPANGCDIRIQFNNQPVVPVVNRRAGIQTRLKYLRVRANIDVEYEYCITLEKRTGKTQKIRIEQQLGENCIAHVSFDAQKVPEGDLTDRLLGKRYKLQQLLWSGGVSALWEKIAGKLGKAESFPYKEYQKSIEVSEAAWNEQKQKKSAYGTVRFLICPDAILADRYEQMLKSQSFSNWMVLSETELEEKVNQKAEETVYIWRPEGDCVLRKDALYSIAKTLYDNPQVDFLYTDEEINGMPYFKSDMDEDLIRSHNYIGQALFVRADVYASAAAEGKWDSSYEYVLQCWRLANEKCHIPEVLVFTKAEEKTDQIRKQEIYALEQYYSKRGIAVDGIEADPYGYYHTRYKRAEEPLVSIIIPNKDHIEDLQLCADSILTRTSYSNYEVLIVENNSTEEKTFAGYELLKKQDPRVQVLTWEREFNYSAINNFAVTFAKGEYLVFLNNDTELLTGDWLEELLGRCMQPEVGAAGVKLYYADRTIQHAGVVIGLGGLAGHAFGTCPETLPTYLQYGCCMRGQSAVTAACMMVKRGVFEAAGGFCEALQVAFNDIDLCLNIRKMGQQIVYNPYVELYHYESKSRGMEDTQEKVERFHKEVCLLAERHPYILKHCDEFYNPNLTIDKPDFSFNKRSLHRSFLLHAMAIKEA